MSRSEPGRRALVLGKGRSPQGNGLRHIAQAHSAGQLTCPFAARRRTAEGDNASNGELCEDPRPALEVGRLRHGGAKIVEVEDDSDIFSVSVTLVRFTGTDFAPRSKADGSIKLSYSLYLPPPRSTPRSLPTKRRRKRSRAKQLNSLFQAHIRRQARRSKNPEF